MTNLGGGFWHYVPTLKKWIFEYFCDTIHDRKIRYAVGVGRAWAGEFIVVGG